MPVQDNRPAVYLDGDTVIYRASALGGCPRALWAARSQLERTPIPPTVQAGMDEGTNLEPVILDLLYEKHGWTFGDGAQEVLELSWKLPSDLIVTIRGKVDEIGCPAAPGIPNDRQKHRPIDVKAFTNDDVVKFRRDSFSAFPRYEWQQSFYGLAYQQMTDNPDAQFYMPIFNKGTWQIEPWSLKPHYPTVPLETLIDRIQEVEKAFESGTMPESCPADFACPYPYLHEDKSKKQLPDNALPFARARIAISQRIDSLTKARKELDEKLKPYMTEGVSYTVSIDDDGSYNVSLLNNPDRFNTAAAKALLTSADIDWENDPEYLTPGVGTQVRFTTSRKKGGNDG